MLAMRAWAMAAAYRPREAGINAALAALAGDFRVLPLDRSRRQGHLAIAMNDSAPDSLIPYDEIVQEALRAVVGRVLGEIVAQGGALPGNHHFYITFKTGAPGVAIPPHLRERFPDEMTIVLQNKFWDLAVDADGFSVGLTFNQVPAKLAVPFSAITAFVDPAVDFGLQFQTEGAGEALEPHEEAENDIPDGDDAAPAKPGSNVVSVDFGRKK
jgi:hypothetical protein